ncbi:MAG: hypothetical protein K0V04_31195 [Deltaproteobacteria bacterium]|nr:hypothetical protein [Deltaproteobacteria bacterium]
MRRTQRGATLTSVMLLLIALVTAGLLGVRSARRELDQSGAAVARERARNAIRAVVGLTQARLEVLAPARLDTMLAGRHPQGPGCDDRCRDCLPTGARWVAAIDDVPGSCVTPPCSRPGAVVDLPDGSGARVPWCDVPLRQLLPNADPEARVWVWVRNDTADGLDGGGWSRDQNRSVVVTARTQLRGTTLVARETVPLRTVSARP